MQMMISRTRGQVGMSMGRGGHAQAWLQLVFIPTYKRLLKETRYTTGGPRLKSNSQRRVSVAEVAEMAGVGTGSRRASSAPTKFARRISITQVAQLGS